MRLNGISMDHKTCISMLDNFPIGIVIFMKSKFVFANKYMYNLYKLQCGSFIDENVFFSNVHIDDSESEYKLLKEFLEDNIESESSYRLNINNE